jgi:hypothetical protein
VRGALDRLPATLLHMFTARRREMATITTREPAYRKDGGIEVALFWDRLTGKLSVCVTDLTSGLSPLQESVHHDPRKPFAERSETRRSQT